MLVIKQLAADLEVELAPYLFHPLENGLDLFGEIALVVERDDTVCDCCHEPPGLICAPFRKESSGLFSR